MARTKLGTRSESSVSPVVDAGFSDPSADLSLPTFVLDYIPGRFAVVVYDGPSLVEVDREFLTWRDARGRARELSTMHMGSDRWAAAVPQPVSRATFAASSASRSA